MAASEQPPYGAVAFSEIERLGAGRLVKNRVETQTNDIIGALDAVLSQNDSAWRTTSNLRKVEGCGVAKHSAVILLGFLHGRFRFEEFVAAMSRGCGFGQAILVSEAYRHEASHQDD